MENVILAIHLLLALGLVGVVLLQRSEGGGLGMGGGGGIVSGRTAATALGKVTWGMAVAFVCTSMWLTIIAAQNSSGSSVIDRLGGSGTAPVGETDASLPALPDGDSLLPPTESDSAPLVPSAD